MGTFCLVDTQPRDFTEDEEATFSDLAETVIAHLRLALVKAERAKVDAVVEEREAVILKQNGEIELRPAPRKAPTRS